MKKWIAGVLLATFVTAAAFAAGGIGDARKEGKLICIYNSSGKKIATINWTGREQELLGVTSDFIVVKDGNFFVTYDENGKKLGSLSEKATGGNMVFDKAVGSNFFTKDKMGSATYLRTWDKTCRQIGNGQLVR